MKAENHVSVVRRSSIGSDLMAALPAEMAAMSWLDDTEAGGCRAWPLPLDTTCASVARRLFHETARELGLPEDIAHDGVTMASELAANTLHAQGNVEFDGSRQRPVTGFPELWLYVRGAAEGRELVCKVFDSERAWKSGTPPDPAEVKPDIDPVLGFELAAAPVAEGADADVFGDDLGTDQAEPDLDWVRGRGLRVVAGLSGGRWGHHLSRARLGRWKVPGKVVWFTLPTPTARSRGRPRAAEAGSAPFLSPRQVAKELEAMLADRGIGRRLVRCDEPVADMSVLSVCQDLSVWCRQGHATWRTPAGDYASRPLSDLVEICEQVVCVHEELDVIRRTAARA